MAQRLCLQGLIIVGLDPCLAVLLWCGGLADGWGRGGGWDGVGGGGGAVSSRLRLDSGGTSALVDIREGCRGARWSASEYEVVCSFFLTKAVLF